MLSNYLENEPAIVGKSALVSFLRLDFFFAAVFFYFWFRFISVFTESRLESPQYKPLRIIIFVTSLISAILPFYGDALIANQRFDNGVIEFASGKFWLGYALVLGLLMCGGLFMLVSARKKVAHSHVIKKKDQLDLVYYGSIFSLGLGLFINLLQAWIPISLSVSRLGLYGMVILVMTTAFAIIKAHFFYMRLVIVRTVVPLALVAIVGIGYAAMLFALSKYVFNVPIDRRLLIIGLGVAMLIAITFQEIRKKTEQFASRLILREYYDYEEVMPRLTTQIWASRETSALVSETLLSLKKIMNATHILHASGRPGEQVKMGSCCINHVMKKHHNDHVVVFGICTSDCLLECANSGDCIIFSGQNDGELMVPIRNDGKVTDILIFGQKTSGGHYSPKDLSLLKSFATQFSMALERLSLYEEVKKYSESLEQKVLERTNTIDRLYRNEHEMIIEIAHGLQTPLTILKGKVGLMRQDGVATVSIDNFERSIDMASAFIYDLLKLSRLESDLTAVHRTNVNLSEVVADIAEYASMSCMSNGIRLSVEIAPMIHVWGDARQLQDAFLNLITNSVKYIGNKANNEITIKLTLSNECARFVVIDTGIGISSVDLPHIFERFYRTATAQATSVRGSGLGLPITKAIIEKHGGTVGVESVLGVGSSFSILLPILRL